MSDPKDLPIDDDDLEEVAADANWDLEYVEQYGAADYAAARDNNDDEEGDDDEWATFA